MNKQLSILFFLILSVTYGQIPAGYYNDAQGLTGYQLKTALKNIITNGHNAHSYNDLYNAYESTDTDHYYENDGTVLDMYSENPTGPDPYNYTHHNRTCGTYTNEGDCYNREHLVPQSWFGSAMPMKSDAHHVVPADGKVNGMRGHLPLADVGSADWISDNGSKRGSCADVGYNGTVFEPIDEFKGDIARIYFYMATRYEDEIGSWENANDDGSDPVLDGTNDHVFENWYLNVLIQWHNQDPVSQREIDRNNAVYNYQGNRNPFIDHPEWVNAIWNPGPNTNTFIINESFSDCDNMVFDIVSEASNKDWHCITQYGEANSPAIQINGYQEDVPSKDWLITKNKIDFDSYTNEKFSVFLAYAYGTTPLELVYSADYDGNGSPQNFTWTAVPNVNIPVPTGSSSPTEVTLSDIDISSISGKVYLAFKYYSNSSPTRWTVDSVKITGDNAGAVNQYIQAHTKIFPNPLHNGEKLFITANNLSIDKVQIINISGQQIPVNYNKQNHIVELINLPSGIYFIKLETDKGTAYKQLIIE